MSKYAVAIGFSKEEFLTKMEDPKYKINAEMEFEFFRKSQYSGMPSLVFVKDGKEHPLSHGFVDFEQIEAKLDALLL